MFALTIPTFTGAKVSTTAGVGSDVPFSVGDVVVNVGQQSPRHYTVGDFVLLSPSSDGRKSTANVHVNFSKSISSPFKIYILFTIVECAK